MFALTPTIHVVVIVFEHRHVLDDCTGLLIRDGLE